MQFLKTLFWVIVAVALVLFSTVNWVPVTINLWGGLQADVKLPVLILIAFLIGLLPMFVVHRARLWTLKRKLGAEGRITTANSAGLPSEDAPAQVSGAPPEEEFRIATDSKAWPTS